MAANMAMGKLTNEVLLIRPVPKFAISPNIKLQMWNVAKDPTTIAINKQARTIFLFILPYLIISMIILLIGQRVIIMNNNNLSAHQILIVIKAICRRYSVAKRNTFISNAKVI